MEWKHQVRTPRGSVGAFISATLIFFGMSLSAAHSVGFVPYYVDGTDPHSRVRLANLPELGEENFMAAVNEEVVTPGVLPERITIPEIGVDLFVQNPSTRDIGALDVLLQSGPVRYVDSALLGKDGNVLIFAHSSNLPVVHNQMFKAFNRIKELETGDIITVYGGGTQYMYSVVTVREVNASEETINLAPKEQTMLTLVTCDTLTSKDARFLVEAVLIGVVE